MNKQRTSKDLFELAGMESTNPSNRALLAVGDTFGWVMGMIILPIFPHFIKDWRQLQFAISLSTIPMLSMAWWASQEISFFVCFAPQRSLTNFCTTSRLVEESPRWLIATRRVDRAKVVMSKIMERNGLLKSPEDLDTVVSKCLQEHQKALNEPKATLLDLFKTPSRLLTTISFYIQ